MTPSLIALGYVIRLKGQAAAVSIWPLMPYFCLHIFQKLPRIASHNHHLKDTYAYIFYFSRFKRHTAQQMLTSMEGDAGHL